MDSDEENEINILNTTRKSRKIIDGESENETTKAKSPTIDDYKNDINNKNMSDSDNDSIVSEIVGKSKGKRLIMNPSSDSDDEELLNQNCNVENLETIRISKNISSRDDSLQDLSKTSKTNNQDSENLMNNNVIDRSFTSDSDSNLENHLNNEAFNAKQDSDLDAEIAEIEAELNNLNSGKRKSGRDSDSEFSGSDRINSSNVEEKNYRSDDSDEAITPKPYKKKRRKEEDLQKMSGREALEQRREILSESQRMLRESQMSLPYHKPKTYTLRQFLQKRAKLTCLLPKNTHTPPAIAIKMSQKELELVSKKLEIRIKEVKEFYKSESDTEEETDKLSVEIKDWLGELVENAICISEKKSEEKNVKIEEPKMEPNKIELLREKIGHIQPKLSGSSYIDLNEDSSNEVTKLVERFIKHTSKKNSSHKKVNLDVISVSNGEIHKETLAMNVNDEEEEKNIIETPGAKLQKLREELQQQIAQKRNELWEQKRNNQEKSEINEEIKEIEDEDYLDDEEEMTDYSLEDDEEEDDVEIKDKPRQKSLFLDDEAEVSEIEEDVEEMNENEEIIEDGFEGDDESNEESEEKPKKRILRRILKAFSEDSDEEDNKIKENLVTNATNKEENKITSLLQFSDEDLTKSKTGSENLDSTISFEEFPSNQTPQRNSEKSRSEFDFLTPVTYLTGLQNLNATSEKQKDSPSLISPFRMPSPLNNKPIQSHLQKNLFGEPSQCNLDELSDLCTGKFSETINDDNQLPTTQDLIGMCSGHFSGLSQTDMEIKSLDTDQTGLITELLNDEEIEEVKATGLIESDNEEELEIRTRKKRKQLKFSDDDSEEEEEEEIEEEIQLQDNVEYDSEENEYQLKPSDFLENEAELSESEWGSADENEDNLDELEFEQGDTEKFDENKMRQDIEKVHMRQLLDDDNREVKILQELLLEDGELHGTGRQRQFKWRNIDSMTEEEIQKNEEDTCLDEEEESEEQWRKKRHEREMFLKRKTQLDFDDEEILNDSQILKFGHKIVQKMQVDCQTTTIAEKIDVIQQPLNFLCKRGSFLNRSDQVLDRLSEYTKVATTNIMGSVKNSRNFVFQSVSNEKILIKDNKRKAIDGTPNAIKKLRLDNLSPAVKGKNSEGKSDRVKKLFGN